MRLVVEDGVRDGRREWLRADARLERADRKPAVAIHEAALFVAVRRGERFCTRMCTYTYDSILMPILNARQSLESGNWQYCKHEWGYVKEPRI